MKPCFGSGYKDVCSLLQRSSTTEIPLLLLRRGTCYLCPVIRGVLSEYHYYLPSTVPASSHEDNNSILYLVVVLIDRLYSYRRISKHNYVYIDMTLAVIPPHMELISIPYE